MGLKDPYEISEIHFQSFRANSQDSCPIPFTFSIILSLNVGPCILLTLCCSDLKCLRYDDKSRRYVLYLVDSYWIWEKVLDLRDTIFLTKIVLEAY